MKLVKYILVSLILSSSVYSKCFLCGVLPSEMNIHMASNEYNEDLIKVKKADGVNGSLNGKRIRRRTNYE